MYLKDIFEVWKESQGFLILLKCFFISLPKLLYQEK